MADTPKDTPESSDARLNFVVETDASAGRQIVTENQEQKTAVESQDPRLENNVITTIPCIVDRHKPGLHKSYKPKHNIRILTNGAVGGEVQVHPSSEHDGGVHRTR